MTTRNDKFDPRNAARRVGAGAARVALLVGGCFQSLAKYVIAAGADIVLYIDVPDEIQFTKSGRGVITVRLVSGETLATLLKKYPSPQLEESLRALPGVNLNVGLGQLRGIGALAARQVVENPAVQLLLTEVFERILVLHNGLVEQAEIVTLTSTAGGTGGPVGPAIARELARLFFEHTEAVVSLQFMRAGSMSFVGLGPRVHRNGAATVAEDVRFILSYGRHPREVRSLVLFELPMVGPRKQERDAFVVQFAQAARSEAVREILGRAEPNVALDSPLGTVTILRPSWWHQLPDRNISREVAEKYLPRLHRILGTPPKTRVVESVEVWLEQDKVQPVQSMDELVSMIRSSPSAKPESFVEVCSQQKGQYNSATVVIRLDGKAGSVDDRMRVLFPIPCRLESEFVEKLSVLRAIDVELHAHEQQRLNKLAMLRRAKDRAEPDLAKSVDRIYPRGFWRRVAKAMGNPNTRLAQFKNAATRLRELKAQLSALEAELQGIRSARAQVAAELNFEVKRLKRVIDALCAVGPCGESPGSSRLVDVRDLDFMLEPLLEATQHVAPDSEEFVRLLGSSATSVTVSGLARITGAHEARAESIAYELIHAVPSTQAPVWGGKKPTGSTSTVFVLPPIERKLLDEIRNVVKGLDPDVVVVCGDTAEAGVNVVQLDVYRPHINDEIFTSFIRINCEKALTEKERYFTKTHGNGEVSVDEWLAENIADRPQHGEWGPETVASSSDHC